jgi:hypothetical protein
MSLDQSLSSRLQSKTVRQSIITSIARDFNLTRILAEAYFKQISDYFLRHAELTLSTGQMQYLAVDENEPAGKPIVLCKKVPVRLTIHGAEEDLAVYEKSGLRALFQTNVPVFGAFTTTCQDIPASGENQISTLSPVDEPRLIVALPLSVVYDFRLVSAIDPGRFLYLSNIQGGRKG